MLEISEKVVAFIQGEVDQQRKAPSVAVPAAIGD